MQKLIITEVRIRSPHDRYRWTATSDDGSLPPHILQWDDEEHDGSYTDLLAVSISHYEHWEEAHLFEEVAVWSTDLIESMLPKECRWFAPLLKGV
jgi:hypothetical protein